MINPKTEKKYDLDSDGNTSKSANCSENLDVKYVNQQIVWIVGGLPFGTTWQWTMPCFCQENCLQMDSKKTNISNIVSSKPNRDAVLMDIIALSP